MRKKPLLGVVIGALVFLSIAGEGRAYTAADYNAAGLQFYHAQNYAQAAQYFETALQIDPQNAQALMGAANCYYSQGQTAKALVDYQKLQALQPTNSQLTDFVTALQAKVGAGVVPAPAASPTVSDLQQGETLFAQKQFSAAVPFLQKAAAANPNDPSADYYLGSSQVQSGDFKDGTVALSLYNQAKPSGAMTAYLDQIRSRLSPQDQQWVDSQIQTPTWSSSQSIAAPPAPSATPAGAPKMFELCLEPGVGFVGLDDFKLNSASFTSLVEEAQGGDPSIGLNGSVPQANLNMALEPVLKLGDNLEVGLPLQFFPVGTASDNISDANGYSYSDSFQITAFSVGLNLKTIFGNGNVRPFISGGGFVELISVQTQLSVISGGVTQAAAGTFSGTDTGAVFKAGVDWHVDDSFVVSPFIGYQVTSNSPLTGDANFNVNGTLSTKPSKLVMQPDGEGGDEIYVDSDDYIPPTGSRDLQIGFSGFVTGLSAGLCF